MMKPLISIIIPVYNVEDYFTRCMDSILKQTYTNYEVILVDDGSTDCSGKMCDQYADLYKNVKVYHQQNKGQSAARNLGVLRSKGTLLTFVDSDDYVSLDYLDYLYMLMKKYSVGISCARTERCGNLEEHIKTDGSERVLSTELALVKMCYCDKIDVSPCAKLYKREIILEHPYPEGVIFEDLAISCRHIAEAGDVALGDKIVYHYVIHQGSTIYSKFEEKHFGSLDAAEEQRKFIAENYPDIEYAAKTRCVRAGIALLARQDVFHHKNAEMYFNRIRDFIKPYAKETIIDAKFPIHLKIKLVIIMTGYLPSRFVWCYIRDIVIKYRELKNWKIGDIHS